MWYNRLSKCLIKKEYRINLICLCIFIRKFEYGFIIIVIYVDDMNLIGNLEELLKTTRYLERKFEIKNFMKIKYCISLQIEHKTNSVYPSICIR